jgi:AcrR family transcriptional regulator
VAVARDVFAEQGLEAPLETIAARAGVGIATLYRRFPTREKLIAAALVEKVTEYAEAVRQALAAPDPWDGFAGFVEQICELQAGDRGLSDLLSMTLSADEQVEGLRRTANELLITVIDRAKAAGTLPEDFVGEDLVQNSVLFPLGLTHDKTPAESLLPGHLLTAMGTAGHVASIGLLLAAAWAL